jgi:hypothetical protein
MARQLDLDTKIVALEHDEHFRQETVRTLRDHGVEHLAEVRLAPLAPWAEEGSTPWYSVEAIDDLSEVGLLLVDGPPSNTGPHARFPAVPLLKDKLAADCLVVLDDMVRQDEKEVAEGWREALPDFSYELVNLDKGAGCFRRGT